MVKLPQPNYKGIPVEEAIKKRRSVRSYSKKALTLPQLSQLLFAAQGITGSVSGFGLRAAPSAGALYPIEVYVVVNNIEALSQGIYHYNVQKHAVELLKEGDFRKEITNAGLWQDMLGDANVTFVLSAVFERTQRKYGDRSLRYIYMEAGHISQNIALQAVSLGLGSVSIGAFYDEQVNKLIGLDGSRESVIYLQAVGTL
ncbi:MAG: SagB/ThcOx family dehydrogenase [Thermodesulfobacteriota bacterium]|nr:MAG: SagB/ThcOx family dehydrogenase [Thermodesulfobacteriota bacterium]